MRTIHDGDGTEWRVWKVVPDFPVYYERRRALPAEPYAGEERRRGDLQQGWLCFDSGAERRRVHPVPDDWESCPEAALCELLRRGGARVRNRPLDAE
jgi:hypothetical protein